MRTPRAVYDSRGQLNLAAESSVSGLSERDSRRYEVARVNQVLQFTSLAAKHPRADERRPP